MRERRSPGDTVGRRRHPELCGVASRRMRNALVRLWRFSRTPEGLKVVRYTLVSVISALTSLVILTIVYRGTPTLERGCQHPLCQRHGGHSVLHPQPSVGMGKIRALPHLEGDPPVLGDVHNRHRFRFVHGLVGAQFRRRRTIFIIWLRPYWWSGPISPLSESCGCSNSSSSIGCSPKLPMPRSGSKPERPPETHHESPLVNFDEFCHLAWSRATR